MGFGSINIAVSALQSQREALDTIGHNIANVNTAGYTRQQVQLTALSGAVTPAMYAKWTGGGAGPVERPAGAAPPGLPHRHPGDPRPGPGEP